jgi:hypothetical protein
VKSADDLRHRLDAWVFAAEDARRLAAVRIGLCGLLALRLAIGNYARVAGQPRALFQPLSYMRLFERMPSPAAATTLQVCGIVAALIAMAGLAVTVSLPFAFVCSLILNGMLNSTGRVIVGDAVLTLCLLLLLAGGGAASEAWSIRAPLRRLARGRGKEWPDLPTIPRPPGCGARYGWPIRAAMIAIALAYFFAGIQKWRYSGLPWVTSDNLRWILYASSDNQPHPNGLALFLADRPALAHAFAAGSLLLETSFPLVLFVPRLRWLFLPGAIAMHLGIWLALRLDYSAQWLTLMIVFVNWPVVVHWLRRTPARIRTSHATPT